MPDVRITDLRHFLDELGGLPQESRALRLATRLARIVEAATSRIAGSCQATAVTCNRRPHHRVCPGFIVIERSEVPPLVQWKCPVCGDRGRITGWRGTAWDLTAHLEERQAEASSKQLEVRFDRLTYATLLAVSELDWDSHALLCAARPAGAGSVLTASPDELEFLGDNIIAAANHDTRPTRARRLRTAFLEIDEVVAGAHSSQLSRRKITSASDGVVLRVRVSLLRVRPPVWRRLDISASFSLGLLHHAIQTSLNWDDCHLHEFTSDDGRHIGTQNEWADPDLEDEDQVLVGDLLHRPGDSIRYVYDFGDDWRHSIVLEEILPSEHRANLPRCQDGRGEAPAEDSGPAARSGGTSRRIDVGEIDVMLDWLRE